MNLLTSRSSSFCRGRKRSSSFSTSLNMIATQVWTSFVSNFSSLHLALNYQLFFPKNLPKLATIVNFWTCSVRSGNTDHSLHFPFLQSTDKVSKIKVKRKPPLAAFRKNSRFCAESFVAVRKKISWFISKHSTVSTAQRYRCSLCADASILSTPKSCSTYKYRIYIQFSEKLLT